MAIVQLDDGRIADQFQIGTEPYVLNDALVMQPDVYAALSPEDIQAIKQKRYDNWYAIVTAPPVEISADPEV